MQWNQLARERGWHLKQPDLLPFVLVGLLVLAICYWLLAIGYALRQAKLAVPSEQLVATLAD